MIFNFLPRVNIYLKSDFKQLLSMFACQYIWWVKSRHGRIDMTILRSFTAVMFLNLMHGDA